jgi:hypothetical protein
MLHCLAHGSLITQSSICKCRRNQRKACAITLCHSLFSHEQEVRQLHMPHTSQRLKDHSAILHRQPIKMILSLLQQVLLHPLGNIQLPREHIKRATHHLRLHDWKSCDLFAHLSNKHFVDGCVELDSGAVNHTDVVELVFQC